MLLKCRKSGHHSNRLNGEMPERLNGTVSKTVKGAIPSRVQIPLSPPLFKQLSSFHSVIKIPVRKSSVKRFFVYLFLTYIADLPL